MNPCLVRSTWFWSYNPNVSAIKESADYGGLDDWLVSLPKYQKVLGLIPTLYLDSWFFSFPLFLFLVPAYHNGQTKISCCKGLSDPRPTHGRTDYMYMYMWMIFHVLVILGRLAPYRWSQQLIFIKEEETAFKCNERTLTERWRITKLCNVSS